MVWVMWTLRVLLFYYIGNLYKEMPYANSFDFVFSIVTVYFIPNMLYLFYRGVIQQYREVDELKNQRNIEEIP